MSSKKITTKSGAEVVINPAPWADAKRLKAAIHSVLSRSNKLAGLSFSANLLSTLDLVFEVDSSPELEAALWPCLARCTRDKEGINEAMFDDVAVRADYYEIVFECIKVNYLPLAEGLFSVLGEQQAVEQAQDDTQK